MFEISFEFDKKQEDNSVKILEENNTAIAKNDEGGDVFGDVGCI